MALLDNIITTLLGGLAPSSDDGHRVSAKTRRCALCEGKGKYYHHDDGDECSMSSGWYHCHNCGGTGSENVDD